MIELHYDLDPALLSWSIESDVINSCWDDGEWISLFENTCLCGKPNLILTYENI